MASRLRAASSADSAVRRSARAWARSAVAVWKSRSAPALLSYSVRFCFSMISVIVTRDFARLMPATAARKSFCACTMSAASM